MNPNLNGITNRPINILICIIFHVSDIYYLDLVRNSSDEDEDRERPVLPGHRYRRGDDGDDEDDEDEDDDEDDRRD